MRRLAKCRPPHLLELGILRPKLRGEENKNGESYSTFSVSVPRPGIEPGWVSPLVFETSASTYSAIWAPDFSFASAKIERFL